MRTVIGTDKRIVVEVAMLNRLVYHLLLLKGSWHYRMSLLATYIIAGSYLYLLGFFFSIQPGPASAMASRMDRAMGIVGLVVIAAFVVAAVLWLAALIAYIVGGAKAKDFDTLGFILVLTPPAVFAVSGRVYNEFLNGRGVAIHRFFYELPSLF